MTVVDTNILVRYSVKDDPGQTVAATEFLASTPCLLILTVVLETAWVLASKSGYALERNIVAERIRHLAGLPNITVVDAHALASALEWYEAGMDIADAIHLSQAKAGESFATLDRKLLSCVQRIGLKKQVLLVDGA